MVSTVGLDSPVERFFQFSLLGLLASGYLAVAGSGFLDPPTIVLTGAAIFVRALMAAGVVRFEIPSLVVAGITLAYMGFYPLDLMYVSRDFLPATVHLVFFIAIVKILTARTSRDYFFVKAIAFLELLAACVLSSSFNFFLFLALFLLLGVATFMSSEIRQALERVTAGTTDRAQGTGRRLAGAVFSVSVGILTMTAILFFLLPRTARAAFQHFFHNRYHLTGFSNEVNLGEIGEVKQQSTPVFHVQLGPHTARPTGILRWRGSALAEFDGRRWSNPKPWTSRILKPDATGRLILDTWRKRPELAYSVHLNGAAPSGTLFFAGTPQSMRVDAPAVEYLAGDSYRVRGASTAGLSYQAFSYLEPSSGDPEGQRSEPPHARIDGETRRAYLQLPAIDPGIARLAQSFTGESETLEGKARLLERRLRTGFGYTLELPKTESADPVADFLFRRKKGHCEYFASSMTVMLRTLGIPARVVTGFAGGVYNPISGWYVVRASDAHSWVEAYLPHLGWTTFDPTPPDPNPPAVTLWTRMGFYLDAAELFWQDWVLNYDLNRQLLVAARMEERGQNLRLGLVEEWSRRLSAWASNLRKPRAEGDPGQLGLGVSAVLFLLLGLRYGRPLAEWCVSQLRYRKARGGRAEPGDATLFYEQMLKLLKRKGIEKPAWSTPLEFAGVVKDPELRRLVVGITEAYNDLRFGGRAEAAGRMADLMVRLRE